MKKIAIVTTHPIQYYAPLFKLLAKEKELELKVFYTWSQSQSGKFDPGFGKTIEWDIPILDGYSFEFVENISKDPGTHHYKGIVNPNLNVKIEDFGADVVLVIGWSFDSHFKTMKYFKGKIPVIFRGDSHLLDSVGLIKNLIRKISLRYVYSFVDYALYVGKNNKEYYKFCGLKENQLVYAPHAIDNDRFQDPNNVYKTKAFEWREKIGIPKDGIVFLFAGKFEPKKRPDLLINSFIKAGMPNTFLILMGNGEMEKELISLSKAHEKRIYFLPFQNQSIMPIAYRMGNVFCLPSQGPGETWGLAVNEAMVCGLPILVSDKVGCAVDLIEQGKNGFVFTSNDFNDLTDKIKLLGNVQIVSDMSLKSSEKIKNWNLNSVVQSIHNILK